MKGTEGMTMYNRESLKDFKNHNISLYFQKGTYYTSVEEKPKGNENEEEAVESKDNVASRTEKIG